MTYPQCVWEWLPAWERSCYLVEQKENVWALPNAEIMIHQSSGGAQGQATEIEIAAEHILRTREIKHDLKRDTGQPYETIVKDTERDNWLTAQEALEYGLIDKVMENR